MDLDLEARFSLWISLFVSRSPPDRVCSITSCVIHADGQVLLLSLSSQLDPSILFLVLTLVFGQDSSRQREADIVKFEKKKDASVCFCLWRHPISFMSGPLFRSFLFLCPFHFFFSLIDAVLCKPQGTLSGLKDEEWVEGRSLHKRKEICNEPKDCEERNRQLN